MLISKRIISQALVVLLIVMQTGSAWAMSAMPNHAGAPAAPLPAVAASLHDHHAMQYVPDSATPQAAADTDCDDLTNSLCNHCSHCVAVIIEAIATVTLPSPPYIDRTVPSIDILKSIHFKPPRLS